MTVARDHLGADRFGCQAHHLADMLFHRRVDVREGADCAGNGPRRNFGSRVDQPGAVARHLGVEPGEGQAHGRGFGMNPVAAPDADGVLVFEGARLERGQNPVQTGQKQVGRARQLDVECGVEHVGTGHALMHEARLVGPDMFGKVRQEGDHVMLGDGLDLVDAGHVEGHILCAPDRFGIGLGDHAKGGLRVAGMRLDLEPDAELGFGRPEGDHLGAGIARNHAAGPLRCR